MSDMTPHPPGQNPPGQQPAGPPPSGAGRTPPPYPSEPYAPREGKPVSFYLAIFLALLLFVSGGLNLLLLVVSAFGSATAGLGGGATIDDGAYEVVVVEGDAQTEARLLRVPIDGAIAEASTPVIGATGGTVSAIRRSLKLAARDDRIKGVLLDVNSPGGGVTDSDLVWKEISDFKRESQKPVVAVFGDVAASGGYYVAVACDHIVARPTTITGSIGVVLSNLNFSEAAQKFGIHQDTIVSARTPYKDIMSPFKAMSDDERAILTSIVDEMYDRFVDIVHQGRPGLSRERIVELADGRIYSAQQALEVGLIDEIGSIDDALASLRQLCDLEESQVVEQRRRPTIADLLFGMRSPNPVPTVDESLARLLGVTSGPKLLYYWSGAR